MEKLNVLIGMEKSGVIRRAMRSVGHNAWSCDLEKAKDDSPFHYQECIFKAVKRQRWDLFIAHPECTYLSSSGYHWVYKRPERMKQVNDAIDFFMKMVDILHEIGAGVLENPIGIMSTHYRKPDQIIQPYNYGDDASKNTCLWTVGVPRLVKTMYTYPRWVCNECGITNRQQIHHKHICNCPSCGDRCKPRWGNQTDNGQNKLAPSPTRKAVRSETYPGIAQAMAEQWTSKTINKTCSHLFAMT